MYKKNFSEEIKTFETTYQNLNKDIYSSIASEFKRVQSFKKTIKSNISFQKLLTFLGFKEIPNIIDNDYIKIHKNIVKISKIVPNKYIEYIQISNSFILKQIFIFKEKKIIYKNIVKNNHPLTKDSLKGILDKKFFKSSFKKRLKVITDFAEKQNLTK